MSNIKIDIGVDNNLKYWLISGTILNGSYGSNFPAMLYIQVRNVKHLDRLDVLIVGDNTSNIYIDDLNKLNDSIEIIKKSCISSVSKLIDKKRQEIDSINITIDKLNELIKPQNRDIKFSKVSKL